MSWPNSQDPFYIYNRTEADARRSYYGVNGIPTWFLDGKEVDTSPFWTWEEFYIWFRGALDSLSAIPSPIRINLATYTFPPTNADSIRVKVDVIAEQAVHGTLMLRGAIEESWRRAGQPEKWHYIMRDLFPTSGGQALPDMAAGDSLHYEFTVVYNDSCYTRDRIIATVWVQDDSLGTNRRVVHNSATQYVPEINTDVALGDVPLRVVLDQNVPNPFNPETSIGFVLDQAGKVRLSVFESTGRFVTDLVNGSVSKGPHTVRWDGRDRFGRDVGSGVYYYRLDAESSSLTRKMILIR
jgi:hypothetical protein